MIGVLDKPLIGKLFLVMIMIGLVELHSQEMQHFLLDILLSEIDHHFVA